MSIPQRYGIGFFVVLILSVWCLQTNWSPILHGTVTATDGPVAKALVREQGNLRSVRSDCTGQFRLPLVTASRPITASKPGYRIGSATMSADPLTLRLVGWPAADNPDYPWIDPHPNPQSKDNCANCHGEMYREWQNSAHAKSATNPKFLALFAGQGSASWNVRSEYLDGAGVCATCHAPTLRSTTLEYDVREAVGVARSGVHCDYCHKVVDAPTDKLGTRLGRDGLALLRPAAGDLFSLGPLDDAVRPGESFGYLRLYKESRYCASCHEGTVFGVHAYGTYSEWLESPARKEGRQCQDCHMAPTGRMTNIAPLKGGIEREPSTLASHRFPGAERDLLRQSVKVQVVTIAGAPSRRVDVEIVAERVGHRVPTGFPDRHLILVVEAHDSQGHPVDLLQGPRLPPGAGKWSKSAGVLYGKQLFDDQGHTPVPFWRHIDKVVDTRLFPQKPEQQAFLFPDKATDVRVKVWYRRFWQEVAEPRGWQDNDLLIVEKTVRWQDRLN